MVPGPGCRPAGQLQRLESNGMTAGWWWSTR